MTAIVEVFGVGVGRLVSESAHYAVVRFDAEGHEHIVHVAAGEYKVIHNVGYEVL